MNKKESVTFITETETISNQEDIKLLKKQLFLTNIELNIDKFDTSHEIRYEDTVATENHSETSKKIIKYDNTIIYKINDNDSLSLNNNISQISN